MTAAGYKKLHSPHKSRKILKNLCDFHNLLFFLSLSDPPLPLFTQTVLSFTSFDIVNIVYC